MHSLEDHLPIEKAIEKKTEKAKVIEKKPCAMAMSTTDRLTNMLKNSPSSDKEEINSDRNMTSERDGTTNGSI